MGAQLLASRPDYMDFAKQATREWERGTFGTFYTVSKVQSQQSQQEEEGAQQLGQLSHTVRTPQPRDWGSLFNF